jgi:hypothetical protein
MNHNPFAAGSGGGVDFGTAMTMPRLTLDSADTDSTANVSDFQSLINLLRDPSYRKEALKDTLAFQKEQMAEAGKYKALFGLPKQIMDSFTIPAAIAATGDIAAANMLAQAGTNIGQLYGQGVKPMQVNVPTVNYGFGR